MLPLRYFCYHHDLNLFYRKSLIFWITLIEEWSGILDTFESPLNPPRYFGEGDRTPKAEPFEEPLNPG